MDVSEDHALGRKTQRRFLRLVRGSVQPAGHKRQLDVYAYPGDGRVQVPLELKNRERKRAYIFRDATAQVLVGRDDGTPLGLMITEASHWLYDLGAGYEWLLADVDSLRQAATHLPRQTLSKTHTYRGAGESRVFVYVPLDRWELLTDEDLARRFSRQ